MQFAKDLELLDTKQLDEVVWTFFKNPKTGLVVASNELLQMFTGAQKMGYKIRTQILGLPQDAIKKAVTTAQ